MKSPKTLILNRKNIEKLVNIKKTIKCVEEAFREYGLKRAQMPAKIYLYLNKFSGDFRAMPAYIEKLNRCTLKWVNAHPLNKKFGLPSVMAIVILNDPRSGFPLSIMDGTYLTSLRTGASGAVAAKHLAKSDSKVVSMVGCGIQAKEQLRALNEVFKIKEVKVWGHQRPFIKSFMKDMKKLKVHLTESKSIRDCVKEGDSIVTTTPSRKPIVKLEWIKEGAHINAIGADAKGKQELDPRILKRSKVVVDDWAQASHSGEINVPLRKKLLSQNNINANLGEIVCGKKRGRVNDREITVFDSTGLAIQDTAVADLIYKTARKKKIGRWIQMI